MKLKLLIIALLTLSHQCFASANLPAIKGFQEWKAEKITVSAHQVHLLRIQALKAQAEGNKKNQEAIEKQLDQSKWNLEVVQDLSVTDYFVLYLSQHPHPDRFQQAATKMSIKEVALMMEAYANTLNPSPTEAVVRPQIQAADKARLPVHATQNRGQVK